MKREYTEHEHLLACASNVGIVPLPNETDAELSARIAAECDKQFGQAHRGHGRE